MMPDDLSSENKKSLNYFGEPERDCSSSNCQICNFIKEVM